MTLHRGKKHDYLGMTLDFSKDGAFIVDMEEYLKEILKDLPKDMHDTAPTPAVDHVLKLRDNAPKLNEERADLFIVWWRNCWLLHNAVAQTFEQWFLF